MVWLPGFSCWMNMILDRKDNEHLAVYTAHQEATCANMGYNGFCVFYSNALFPLDKRSGCR